MMSEVQSNPLPMVRVGLEDRAEWLEKQLYLRPTPSYLPQRTPINCLKLHF